MTHPEKLKEDAIVEALCDIRFTASPDVPEEVVIGWLIDCGRWRGWKMRRLPSSDIPASIRRSEEQLRFQPSVELRDVDRPRLIKIGSNVISLHFMQPYPGWQNLQPQLREMVDALFSRIEDVEVSRIGLRYINAFQHDRHRISGVYDLDLSVCVDGKKLQAPLNINFMDRPKPTHTVMTRVASVEFVRGSLSPSASAIADIDVFTPESFSAQSASEVLGWVEVAHNLEKDAFFALLPGEIVQDLKEK
ncbi:TIGR04255 family protein [Methylonatrum kenyense]|uniref:TIGR04255 family protein n=1 Tax=Methylonatrum kenyense TaxID=455253 RepID=UPI0020BE635D|nr:TIGR04255 family protein [Methylonatrum kenyense]MCK8516974.1 TIGR04255 family protein [Methylonatrum kenyense]